MQLACQWGNLAHPAVECVVPTLIEEAGPDARPIEDKCAELVSIIGFAVWFALFAGAPVPTN